MITEIKKIKGIGRFINSECSAVINKNQVIFGFNGTGKSTISDIFYSMKNDSIHINALKERKTLKSVTGVETEKMEVSFIAENDEIYFNGNKWNKDINIHVFNDQYINEYLFIGDKYSDTEYTIGFGQKETKLLKEKNDLENDIKEKIDFINSVISNNKTTCKNAKLQQNKISYSNYKKRIEKIAELNNFKLKQKESLKEDYLKFNTENPNYIKINDWLNIISNLHIFYDDRARMLITQIPKLLLSTPEITGKEISEHMQKYMTKQNPDWLAIGKKYQKSKDLCPFCGQQIKNTDYDKFAKSLNRYIKGKQKQKSDYIKAKTEKTIAYLNMEYLKQFYDVLNEIINKNNEEQILTKRTMNLIYKISLPESITFYEIELFIEKLNKKSVNPYEKITLSDKDTEILIILKKLFKGISTLRIKIETEKNRLFEQIQKEENAEYKKGLYEIFWGENSYLFAEAIKAAKTIKEASDRINEINNILNTFIDSCKLKNVNDFLEEVNVNFKVEIVDNSYRVKINGFESSEYKKDNKILCSEGERKMLAFAYFLQEISEDKDKKIIVVDDPVSSMDANRRSVVAYKLINLMSDRSNQIIILSHDLYFVERLNNLGKTLKNNKLNLLQLKKTGTPFVPLNLDEYLTSDKLVYEQIIEDGIESDNQNSKIIALMAMRPYTWLHMQTDDINKKSIYDNIEKRSTYFAHSKYAENDNIKFFKSKYSERSLKRYFKDVNKATDKDFNIDKFFDTSIFKSNPFLGFDFYSAWELYESINTNSMLNIRKKALVLRIVLETNLCILKDGKKKLDPERIGNEYAKLRKCAEQSTKNTKLLKKYEIINKLCKLYEFSKKYHHGAEEGSSLGISSLNPEEMRQFDNEIHIIHNWIIESKNL